MEKYTTEQLKSALIGLHKMKTTDPLNLKAYQLAFDELEKRMGSESFDKWLDDNNI